MPDPIEEACPLCSGGRSVSISVAHGRRFLECPGCGLLFVAMADRPTLAAERTHYDTHENTVDDPGYREWVSPVADQILARLPRGAEGLDYGSGPAPALAEMITDGGLPTQAYDPAFRHDESLLTRRYDFVTCTEVAEHFHDPYVEFCRLGNLVMPGGWIVVMTEFYDRHRVEDWRYARDPTHVCFFAETSMKWIADRFGWTLRLPGHHIALFHKPLITS